MVICLNFAALIGKEIMCIQLKWTNNIIRLKFQAEYYSFSIIFVCHTICCFVVGTHWHAGMCRNFFYELSSFVLLKFSLINSIYLCHRRFSVCMWLCKHIRYTHFLCRYRWILSSKDPISGENSYSIFLFGKKVSIRIEIRAQEVSTKNINKVADFNPLHAKWLRCFTFTTDIISNRLQCEVEIFFLL